MTEIERIEKEIKNFDKSGYLISSINDGREITYTIVSEDLKESLRNILHSTRKWQIEYVVEKGNITEFATEANNKFGLYQKCLDGELDKFTVLEVNNQNRNNFSSPIEKRRERFIRLFWENEESKRRVEEARRRHEARSQGLDYENGDYVSYTFRTNKRGEWIGEKKENFADPNQKGIVKKGLGYKAAQQAFSILAKEGVFPTPTPTKRLERGEQGEKEPETNSDNKQESSASEKSKRSHEGNDGGRDKRFKAGKEKASSSNLGEKKVKEGKQKSGLIGVNNLINSGKEFCLRRKKQLMDKIDVLMRREIDEFEKGGENNEFNKIRQEISEKESGLKETKEALRIIELSETNQNSNNNNSLTPRFISGSIIFLVVGILGIAIIRSFRRGKRDR